MKHTKREEKYKDEIGANYKQRTKESLKAEISYRTKELNRKLKNLDASMTGVNIVKNAIETANLLSDSKNRDKLIAGIGKSRSKESLIRQARELKSIENIDFYTEEGQKKLEKRFINSYKAFCTNLELEYEDNEKDKKDEDNEKDKKDEKDEKDIDVFTEEDYRNMVEAFGAIGQDILSRKSSDDFVDAYQQASEKGKIKFVDLWNKAEEDFKGLQKTTFEQMEYFKELLRNYGE